MPPSHLARIRRICLALPEVTEVEAWESATFRVGKIFAMHGGDKEGREGVWVKSDSFTQDLLVRGQPTRYFKPPYVGPQGWTGIYLDAKTDWEALTILLRDAWRATAPKKIAALLPDDDEVAPAPKKRPRPKAKRATRDPKPATRRKKK